MKNLVSKRGKTRDEEVRILKDKYHFLQDHYEKLVKVSKQYVQVGQASVKDADNFGETLTAFGLSEDNLLGETLAKIGECQKSLNSMQTTMFISLLEAWVVPIQKFLEDLRKAKTIKKNLQNARNRYDSLCTKFKKLQQNPEKYATKLPLVEEDLKASQQNYEHLIEQFSSTIDELEQRHAMELTVHIKSHFNAHLCFFAQGYTLLSELQAEIESIGSDAR
eukprot:TRINITY_DN12197_c0_g1_i1.p1 TRINITY_DN12197_c0_g1~~TRINITY_DN12197_c0_g1_i1.p1  ORF type:complete len:221 (+),score=43.51 TRINITY_DN12197_c0_g1_i1:66-728(+)